MILKKLYSEPEVFEPVEFKIGINYIFGKKEVSSQDEVKKSLNGIGKSTFLDLIDFALLSSYNKQHNKRLFAAYEKDLLKGVSIILDFDIDSESYSIKRSFDNQSTIYFSIARKPYEEYQINNLKPRLCDLIFKRKYEGYYSDKWFRRLISFYIKIQDPEKEPFINPIKYIRETNEVELNTYHFFFLNMDNRISHENLTVQGNLSKIENTIKETNKILLDTYGSNALSEIDSKLRSLTIETQKLESSINTFKLGAKYKIDEEQADRLTEQIKELWFENSSDEQKLRSYEQSLKLDITITSKKISRLYSEFNLLLGQQIQKSLDEAIEFRKNLIESRRDFISDEMERLKKVVSDRTKEIDSLENRRAEIFKFLKAKKAIKDLSEAHFTLNKKKEEISSIESRVKLLKDLQKKQVEIKRQEIEIEKKILEFKDSIKNQELEFVKIFTSVYNSLYPEFTDTTIFDITANLKSNAKMQFTILPNNEMLSKGRNQGRTLIYDLSVLFYEIEQKIKSPRFLIHDGILDGVDKTHFIELVKYLEEQNLQGKKFQYILTLNEEGELNQKFGDADVVNPVKIENEAILVLTPNKKLFGKNF